MTERDLNVTDELAAYASVVRLEDLPPEVVEGTKRCILHQLGATVAGSTVPWVTPVHRYVQANGGTPESTVVNFGTRVPAQDAAFVNSAFAMGSHMGHPFQSAPGSGGGVTVPVALALAEKVPLGGKEVIAAIAMGYDLQWRLQNSMMPSLMQRGFYPPGVCGVFVAAAVAGRLLGLGPGEIANAFGIAASHASGTLAQDQGGGDSHIINMGSSARHGIQAVLLTQLGLVGPRKPLEGERGVGRAFSDATRWEAMTQGLGRDYKVLDVSFNQYPVGPLEAPLNTFVCLVEEHGVRAAQAEEIRFHISADFLRHGANIYEPWDRASALWSLPFSCGLRLVTGGNEVASYCDPAMWKNRQVLSIARKVVSEANPEATGPRRRLTRLVVRLKDGRALERIQQGAKGSPIDPWTAQEMEDRFCRATARVFSPTRQQDILSFIQTLEASNDIRKLPALLVAG